MKVGDHIVGPVIAVIGAAILIAASQQPRPFFGGGYGGGFLPSILGSGLLVSGLVLGWTGWRARATSPLIEFGDWVESPRHIGNVAVVIGALIFYILTSDSLGFLLSGTIVLFVTLLQFTRHAIKSLLVSLIAIVVIKVMFQDILLVPLPWGILEDYAGVLTWR